MSFSSLEKETDKTNVGKYIRYFYDTFPRDINILTRMTFGTWEMRYERFDSQVDWKGSQMEAFFPG